MSRSPAKSGKATATKSLKEKWLSIVQLVEEKGENGTGGSSTITLSLEGCQSLCEYCPSSLSRTLGTLWYALHNKGLRISLVPPPQVMDLSQPSQVTPGGHALACPFMTNTMIQ